MKTLSYDKLCQLSREALASPRLRMNSNFHPQLSDPIQRLAIAMEPGTYIRPHRHSATWELLSPLRGRFVVLTLDDAGQVSQRAVLGEDISAVEIPQAGWHAVLSGLVLLQSPACKGRASAFIGVSDGDWFG